MFRVFERGGRVISSQFPEIALPNSSGTLQKLDEPGRPDIRQSNRGPGTGSRIAVPVINITKTRLNDPHLWFLGTNDQPGDYRSSGCSACHAVYANDRDEKHSGVYAHFGHKGDDGDPTIRPSRPDESGHPIRHEFTRAIPSSQCMVCHMHQPNVFVNSYYGTIMWDYESDAPSMWPKEQKYPTAEEARRILDRNPEEASIRGKWGDPEFLKNVSTLNPQLKDTQFADYHGHGWNFRAVFKRDRKGTLLDKDGKPVADDDPEKFSKARAPHVDPPRPRHALRRLPLLAGHARQRPHLRRGCRGGRDRLRRLPRHRGQVPDAAHLGPGLAPRRHRPVAAAHPGRAPALRVAPAASSTSAPRSIPTASGR